MHGQQALVLIRQLNTNTPSIVIQTPSSSTIYKSNGTLPVTISFSGRYSLQKVDIFINGVFVNSIKNSLTYTVNLSDIDSLNEENELKIIGYDSVYNKTEQRMTFKVVSSTVN